MSYADMITILMAFFVVMYSMAGSPDKTKENAVFESLRHQFSPMMPGWLGLGRGLMPRHDSDLTAWAVSGTGNSSHHNRNKGGADQRAPHGDHSRVTTLWPGQPSAQGGVVLLSRGIGTRSTNAQERQLQIVAEELSGKPQKIEIRGHTSRRPIPPRGRVPRQLGSGL